VPLGMHDQARGGESLMAFDFGERRIGVALGNTITGGARPLAVIEQTRREVRFSEIAALIEMDISTVSRVVSAKSVQTDFGMYPLKYFFTEGILNDSGEDFSTRELKNILREIIENESPSEPYSDEDLEQQLAERGFVVKRRTVAKYREQMGIAVSRLRKEL
jgi:RNA polymerase sigma-54 factor